MTKYSFWSSDFIWRHRTGSTLAHIGACWLPEWMLISRTWDSLTFAWEQLRRECPSCYIIIYCHLKTRKRFFFFFENSNIFLQSSVCCWVKHISSTYFNRIPLMKPKINGHYIVDVLRFLIQSLNNNSCILIILSLTFALSASIHNKLSIVLCLVPNRRQAITCTNGGSSLTNVWFTTSQCH